MYFYGSTLRTPDMDLYEMTGVLEVTQSEIATELKVNPMTVNKYFSGELHSQKMLGKIYRYLNSREYHCGYIFMPSAQFSKFLKEVIDILKSKYTETFMAKRIGMTKDKLSKIKNGTISYINIVKQQSILKELYDMCRDENSPLEDEYISARDMLAEVLAVQYPAEVTVKFSEIINEIAEQCERCQDKQLDDVHCVKIDEIKEALDKYGLGDEIENLRADNNFIPNNEIRSNILNDLYMVFRRYGELPSEMNEYNSDHIGLYMLSDAVGKSFNGEKRRFYELYRKHLEILKKVIFRHSDLLIRIILDHIHAFIEDELTENSHFHYVVLRYMPPTDSIWHQKQEHYHTELPMAEYKFKIMRYFRRLSIENRVKTCEELRKVLDDMERMPKWKFDYSIKDGEGHLGYDDSVMHSATFIDSIKLVMLTANGKTLRDLDEPDTKMVPNYNMAEFCKWYIEKTVWHSTRFYSMMHILETKLDFESVDWLFWAMLSRAVDVGLGLDDTTNTINKRLEEEKAKQN